MDAGDVIKTIKAARANPVGFAFGVAATLADNVLLVDRLMNGTYLVAQVKKERGVKQSCGGTVSWDGAEAVFTCEKPLSNLEKLIEGWLRAHKLSLKVSVLAGHAAIEQAAETEEEEEDDDDDEEEEEEEDEEEEDAKSLFSPVQVVRRLKQSKTKEMNFAFGLAAGKAANLLALHPIKDGEKLFRLIRAENGAARKSLGKVTLEGALVTFTCDDKPLPGLKRLLRLLFKDWKLAYRVSVVGPEGEVDDAEDAEGEGEGEAIAETADAAAIAALRQDLAMLLPKLQGAARLASSNARVIREFYQACEQALNAGALAEAEAAFARLQELAKAGDTVAAQTAALRAALEALLPSLKPIVANDRERGPTMRETYMACDKALKAGNANEGARLLTVLRDMIGAPAVAGDAGILDRWKRVRSTWDDAVDTVDRQIALLQTALKTTDDEDMKAIAEYGLNAMTGNLKVRLTAAMMDIDRAGQAGFTEAAPKALGIVQNFQRHLDGDERIAAVDSNPFGVKMSVRETLGGALAEMEKVLKAG